MHTIAPPDSQLQLLNVIPRYRITKNAQARNAYGTVASELVCAALALNVIRINGNYSVCFDAERDGTYYEIKSVRRHGGKVVIYDWRMEKERESGVPLNYAILCHNVRRSNGARLVEEMIDGGVELLVVEACIVHALASEQPLREITSRSTGPHCGYNRTGYKDGYRNVPVNFIRERLNHTSHVSCTYAGIPFIATLHTRSQIDTLP
jgi:hypothetical protein